jgi:hypothetical protein
MTRLWCANLGGARMCRATATDPSANRLVCWCDDDEDFSGVDQTTAGNDGVGVLDDSDVPSGVLRMTRLWCANLGGQRRVGGLGGDGERWPAAMIVESVLASSNDSGECAG